MWNTRELMHRILLQRYYIYMKVCCLHKSAPKLMVIINNPFVIDSLVVEMSLIINYMYNVELKKLIHTYEYTP